MPNLSITKTYSNGNTLSETDLDNIKNSIETFINTTKLDNSNIQSGGIATSNIAAVAVDETKLAATVAGNGLSGSAGSPLAVNVDGTTITIITDTLQVAANGIAAAQIANATITTTQIAAGTILGSNIAAATLTKSLDAAMATGSTVAAGGIAISSSSSSYTTTSSSASDVTNLNITITTTGRPVYLSLISGSTSSARIFLTSTSGSTGLTGTYNFTRGGVVLAAHTLRTLANAGTNEFAIPVSGFNYIDVVAAGTYTYTFQAAVTGTGTCTTGVIGALLSAYEL